MIMSSSDKNEIVEKLQEEANFFWEESRELRERSLSLHRQFLARFPFQESPSSISNLTKKDVYNPGSGDYFFYWVEHKLKILGHITLGSSAPFKNASEELQKLRELLKIAIDKEKRLHEKVDAKWESIKGLGGDKHVAKKIIFLYNIDSVYPIFKTEQFEHFLQKLGVDPNLFANSIFNKSYKSLTLGEKLEVLNEALCDFKQKTKPFTTWDNHTFSRLLYEKVPPPLTSYSSMGQVSQTGQPLSNIGLLYEPGSEMEVVVLFSMYHRELGFPYVLSVGAAFPDAIVLDESGEKKSIEFELFSKTFQIHRHPVDECDYIVCWEDNWRDAPDKAVEKIISLKERLKDILL